jgi:hypothetical protein
MILSLLIQKIEEKEGNKYVKKVVMSIADGIAADMRYRIITLVPIHKPITRLSPFNHLFRSHASTCKSRWVYVYGVVLFL